MSEERISILLRLDLTTSGGKFQVISAAVLGTAQDPWPHDPKDFGLAVKNARQRANLSQPKFSRRVGITEQTLRNLESGRNPPSNQTRTAITQFLAQIGQLPPDSAEARQASADAVRAAIEILQSQANGTQSPIHPNQKKEPKR